MFSRLGQAALGAAKRMAPAAARTLRVAAPAVQARSGRMLFGVSALTLGGFALKRADADGKLPPHGNPGTNQERTFIAVKPDGVQRNLVGEIIQRFEKRGYKLVALKMVHPSEKMAAGHYDDLKTKPFFPSLVKYFSSGPVVAMVFEGTDVIATGRKMLGATRPLESNPGTIRGDFCIDVGRNIIHGSDSPDAAKHEINFWFTEHEVVDWTSGNQSWIYAK